MQLGSNCQAAVYDEIEEQVVSADGCNGFTIKRETPLEGKTENQGVFRSGTLSNQNKCQTSCYTAKKLKRLCK